MSSSSFRHYTFLQASESKFRCFLLLCCFSAAVYGSAVVLCFVVFFCCCCVSAALYYYNYSFQPKHPLSNSGGGGTISTRPDQRTALGRGTAASRQRPCDYCHSGRMAVSLEHNRCCSCCCSCYSCLQSLQSNCCKRMQLNKNRRKFHLTSTGSWNLRTSTWKLEYP